MANQEQLTILRQGVEVWNKWREKNPDVKVDLSGADLSRAKLNLINLSYTDLSGADLSLADIDNAFLSGANFSDANLANANLYASVLSGAQFSGAFLSNVCLNYASLNGASMHDADMANAIIRDAGMNDTDLSGADLRNVDFFDTNLIRADFREALVGWTIFGNVDLSTTKGLETVNHRGPSTIGIDTLYRSGGNIPEAFLRGAGIDDTFITYIRSLVGRPIKFHSCFISYSSKDQKFAERLYADLQSKNVRCWYAPKDLKWGEKIHTGIDKAIHFHDKLLLILSKHSIASGWVEREVKTALSKERKDKRGVLFPVRIDKAVLESSLSWATEIRHERNIGDFTRWKEHDEYQKGLDRLLCDLKAT